MKTRRIRAAAVAAIAIALLGVPGSSLADEESLEKARARFDKAQGLFEQGEFATAAEEFRGAYAARPFAQFLYNAGACYEKANDYKNAVRFYQRYLDEQPAASDGPKVKKRIEALKKALDEVEKGEVAEGDKPKAVRNLTKSEPRGLVVIESEPQGALIYLDSTENEPLSKTPWNGSLTGKHTVILEREGYKSTEPAPLRVDPNALTIHYFHLAEQDYLGWVDITSNIQGADIFVDDKSAGVYRRTPFGGNLTPGVHKIWVTKEGYDEHYEEIEIVAGETHKIEAVLKGAEVGRLQVRGSGVDKVSVWLDGEMVCEVGPCKVPVAEGPHTVTIKRPDHKPYTQKIEMQPKTEVTMRVRMAKKPSRTDAVVAYILSAAFFGGGIYAGLQSRDIKRELRSEINAGTPPPDNEDPRLFRGKLWAIGANVGYALGTITFATAVYYTFRDKGPPSTGTTDIRAVSIDPQVGPGYAGVGMGVRF